MNPANWSLLFTAALSLQVLALPARGTTPPAKLYVHDIAFALEALEKECGHFFKLKKIDWKKVSREFLRASRGVKSHQEHLVLLWRLVARLKDGHASVRPLEGGKNVRLPAAFTGRHRSGAGMFWCRSGKKILVKNSWATAARAGIRPGMEILRVNRQPVARWLEKRVEDYADRIGFSTGHQAFFYTCHWGLTDEKGARWELVVKNLKGKKQGGIVTFGTANQVPWGPAFLPKDVEKTRDLNFGRTAKGWGYIHVRRCPQDLPEKTDQALAAVGEAPGLILDFRGNSGGGFDHDAFMGRFIPKGKSISFKKRYRSAGPNPYGGPVVVIVDAPVRSAGETAAGIFKEDGRAYMIGESPTAGMSSSKTTIDLPSGLFSLYVSVHSNKKRFNKGEGIEGLGVIPHEAVAYRAKDLAGEKDTLIGRAEAILDKYPRKKVAYDPARFGWKARRKKR